MAEFLKTNPLDNGKQEKYGMVSHSRILATLTSKGVREDDSLIDYTWLYNCQMIPFVDF